MGGRRGDHQRVRPRVGSHAERRGGHVPLCAAALGNNVLEKPPERLCHVGRLAVLERVYLHLQRGAGSAGVELLHHLDDLRNLGGGPADQNAVRIRFGRHRDGILASALLPPSAPPGPLLLCQRAVDGVCQRLRLGVLELHDLDDDPAVGLGGVERLDKLRGQREGPGVALHDYDVLLGHRRDADLRGLLASAPATPRVGPAPGEHRLQHGRDLVGLGVFQAERPRLLAHGRRGAELLDQLADLLELLFRSGDQQLVGGRVALEPGLGLFIGGGAAAAALLGKKSSERVGQFAGLGVLQLVGAHFHPPGHLIGVHGGNELGDLLDLLARGLDNQRLVARGGADNHAGLVGRRRASAPAGRRGGRRVHLAQHVSQDARRRVLQRQYTRLAGFFPRGLVELRDHLFQQFALGPRGADEHGVRQGVGLDGHVLVLPA